MPPHLADAGLYRSSHTAKHSWAGFQEGPEAPWPVNEIILRSLVLSGRSDAEIAAHYGVSERAVQDLRRHYDF